MLRILGLFAAMIVWLSGWGNARIVVADRMNGHPLAGASVFDRAGRFVGASSATGSLPYVAEHMFPITVRYLGYEEQSFDTFADTLFLIEKTLELNEVLVEAKKRNILHILAYIREYSSLSTYTDTVFLFREKMVDYMLPTDKKVKFSGWTTPRILASQSYYRFTNAQGLDSVSDKCSYHFSWSDWMSMPKTMPISEKDTVMGKYSPSETWKRDRERISVDIDILADTTARKWVSERDFFFREENDFEQFRLRLLYNNVGEKTLEPIDLTEFSFIVDSRGRGHGMYLFNRTDEPIFVSTYGEGYILDKEYITLKEAKKWDKDFTGDIEIYEPSGAPQLQNSVLELISRVNSIDRDMVRLSLTPDQRLAGRKIHKMNPGQMILRRIKGIFGIDKIRGHRKREKDWKEFRKEQRQENASRQSNS